MVLSGERQAFHPDVESQHCRAHAGFGCGRDESVIDRRDEPLGRPTHVKPGGNGEHRDMFPRWERALLWFATAGCGAVLIAYVLGLYGDAVVEPWLGLLAGGVLLSLGLVGLKNEYRHP